MLLTLACLICGLLILIAGTKPTILRDLYFIKIDTTNLTLKSQLDGPLKGTHLDDLNTGLSNKTGRELGLQDFYVSYLWNYCGGNVTTGNDTKVTNCTGAASGYAFNPENIINTQSGTNQTFPGSVTKAQKAVNVVSKVMAVCYILGFVATGVTFVVGWFGLLSRWGSCVTTIFADLSALFLFAASLMFTIMFSVLKTAFNKVIETFGIKATVGHQMLQLTWVMVAFAVAASFFWMLSTCCCSGRTSRVMNNNNPKGHNKDLGVQAPYSYERVPSPFKTNQAPAYGQPYGQQQYGHSVPMNDFGHNQHQTSYEPMRHAVV